MRRSSPAREPGDGAEGPSSARARAGPVLRATAQTAPSRRQNGQPGDVDQNIASPFFPRDYDHVRTLLGSPLPLLNSPPLFQPSPRRNMLTSPARPANQRMHASQGGGGFDGFDQFLQSQSLFSPSALGCNGIFDTPTNRGMPMPADIFTPTPRKGNICDQLMGLLPDGARQAGSQQPHPQQQGHPGSGDVHAERPGAESGGSGCGNDRAAGALRGTAAGSEQPGGALRGGLLHGQVAVAAAAAAGGPLSPDLGLGHGFAFPHHLGDLLSGGGSGGGDGGMDGSASLPAAGSLPLACKDMFLTQDDELMPPPNLAAGLGAGAAVGRRNRVLEFCRTPRNPDAAAAAAAAAAAGRLDGDGGGAGLLLRGAPLGPQLHGMIPALPPLPPLPAMAGAGPESDHRSSPSLPAVEGKQQLSLPPSSNHNNTATRALPIKLEPVPDQGPHATPFQDGTAAAISLMHGLPDMGPLGPMTFMDCGLGAMTSSGAMAGVCGPLDGRFPDFGDGSNLGGLGGPPIGIVDSKGNLVLPPHLQALYSGPNGLPCLAGLALPSGGALAFPGEHPALQQPGSLAGLGPGGRQLGRDAVGEPAGLPPRCGGGMGPAGVAAALAAGAGTSSTPSTLQRPQRTRTANSLYAGGSSMYEGGAASGRRLPTMDLDMAMQETAVSIDGPVGGSHRVSGNGIAPARGRRPSDSANNKSCRCKRSQCLKLYCDCFAAGQYCGACSCVACHNRPEHADRVQQRREDITARDPQAFMRKIQHNGQHKRGCNCRRSHCLKRYCECYQGGVKCGVQCTCLECENMDVPAPVAESTGRGTAKRGKGGRGGAAGRAASRRNSGTTDDWAPSPPPTSTSGCSDGPSPAPSMGTIPGFAAMMLQQQQQQSQQSQQQPPLHPYATDLHPYGMLPASGAMSSGAGVPGTLAGPLPTAGNKTISAGSALPRPFSSQHLQQLGAVAQQQQHGEGAGGHGMLRTSSLPVGIQAGGLAATAGLAAGGACVPNLPNPHLQPLQAVQSEPLLLLPHQQHLRQQQPDGRMPDGRMFSGNQLGQLQSSQRQGQPRTRQQQEEQQQQQEQQRTGLAGADGSPAGPEDGASPHSEGAAESGKQRQQQQSPPSEGRPEPRLVRIKQEQDVCRGDVKVGAVDPTNASALDDDTVMHSANASHESTVLKQQPPCTTTATTCTDPPTAAATTLATAAAMTTTTTTAAVDASGGSSGPRSGSGSAEAAPRHHPPGLMSASAAHDAALQQVLSELRCTPRALDMSLDVVSPPPLSMLAYPHITSSSDTDSDDELGLRTAVRRAQKRRRIGLDAAVAAVAPAAGRRQQGGGSGGHHNQLGDAGMDFESSALADAMIAAIAGEAAAGRHNNTGGENGGAGAGNGGHRHALGSDGGGSTTAGGNGCGGGGGGGLLCGEYLTSGLLEDGGMDSLFLPGSEPNSIEGLRTGASGVNGAAAARRSRGSFLSPDMLPPPSNAPCSGASTAAALLGGLDPGSSIWAHPQTQRRPSRFAPDRGADGEDMLMYDSGALQPWSSVGHGPGSGGGGMEGMEAPLPLDMHHPMTVLRAGSAPLHQHPQQQQHRGLTAAAAAAACVHTLVSPVRTSTGPTALRRRAADVGEGMQGMMPVGNGLEDLRENWGPVNTTTGLSGSSPSKQRFPGISGGGIPHAPLQPLQLVAGPLLAGDGACDMRSARQQQPSMAAGGGRGNCGGGRGGGGGGGRGGRGGRGRSSSVDKELLKASALQYITQRLGAGGPRPPQLDVEGTGLGPAGPSGVLAFSGMPSPAGTQLPLPLLGPGLGALQPPSGPFQQHPSPNPVQPFQQQQQQQPLQPPAGAPALIGFTGNQETPAATDASATGGSGAATAGGVGDRPGAAGPAATAAPGVRGPVGAGPVTAAANGSAAPEHQHHQQHPQPAARASPADTAATGPAAVGGRTAGDSAATAMACIKMVSATGGTGAGGGASAAPPPPLPPLPQAPVIQTTPAGAVQPVRLAAMTKLGSGSTRFFSPNSRRS